MRLVRLRSDGRIGFVMMEEKRKEGLGFSHLKAMYNHHYHCGWGLGFRIVMH